MEYRLTFEELTPYIIAINIFLGILFGSFPLIAGIMAKNRKYAVFGFVGSVFGGAILGVFLSYPVAAIFLWLILRRPSTPIDVSPTSEPEPVSETTII